MVGQPRVRQPHPAHLHVRLTLCPQRLARSDAYLSPGPAPVHCSPRVSRPGAWGQRGNAASPSWRRPLHCGAHARGTTGSSRSRPSCFADFLRPGALPPHGVPVCFLGELAGFPVPPTQRLPLTGLRACRSPRSPCVLFCPYSQRGPSRPITAISRSACAADVDL